MVRLLLFFTLLVASFRLQAQENAQVYSRVKIWLDGRSIEELGRMGIETDHGLYVPGRYFQHELSGQELNELKKAGFRYEVLVPDVTARFLELNQPGAMPVDERGSDCADFSSPNRYGTPQHFKYGSMGGYFQYQEILREMDSMHVLFPGLVSARRPILLANGDTARTLEGRPVYWFRVSDNPETDEPEPEVLYTALHHAREVVSVSQMLYYIWYLLERYPADPEVKYLLEQTEMYFIPCVNPDGYSYNEKTNPSGGGMWRKNRRNNGNNTWGVDLNRNYGFGWGDQYPGSSGDPASDSYRGVAAFSEAETQAVRDFCRQHQFKIAINYHTYSNLFIYPWGYLDKPCTDSATFFAMAAALSRENGFLAGTPIQTVGYKANGVSDDWMYGDSTKGKIFSLTAEVGPTKWGFWPPRSAIIPLCQSTMQTNLTAAAMLLNFGVAREQSYPVLTDKSGSLSYTLQKVGLQDGPLTVSATALSSNIATVGNPVLHLLPSNGKATGAIPFTLRPNVSVGEQVVFLLAVDNGVFRQVDTVRKVYEGTLPIIWQDACDTTAAWSRGATSQWGVSKATYYSAPSSFADSPSGLYVRNLRNEITLAKPVDLRKASRAVLRFRARWDIEADFDTAQVFASRDGVNFAPLCGLYTRNAANGQPVYDGFQPEWVLEHIDLGEYVGSQVWIRFRVASDAQLNRDGMYVDDLEVRADLLSAVANPDEPGTFLGQNEPNPAAGLTRIGLRLPPQSAGVLRFFNLFGQPVGTWPVPEGESSIVLDVSDWTPGLYLYRLEVIGKASAPFKMVVVRP